MNSHLLMTDWLYTQGFATPISSISSDIGKMVDIFENEDLLRFQSQKIHLAG